MLRLRGGQAIGTDPTQSGIDEDLYSRQLYVLGHAAQRSLAASAVLLIGLSGLGAEIGKNAVLAGIGTLDLHDDTVTTHADLSSSFLLDKADLSFARSFHAADRLAPLNPHVRIRTVGGLFTAKDLASYTAVVAVDRPLPELLELNAAARAAGCRFISASSRGPCGGIFCDFGESFRVADADGEEARQALIEHIEVGEETEVFCVPEQPHQLQDGDRVRLAEVNGMPALEEAGLTFPVRVISRHRLAIGDARDLGRYAGGGRLLQVKQPLTLSFAPLSECVRCPRFTDGATITRRRALTTHACFCCAHLMPRDCPPGSERSAVSLRLLVLESGIVAEADLAEDVVKAFARSAFGTLSPVSSFVGEIGPASSFVGDISPSHGGGR